MSSSEELHTAVQALIHEANMLDTVIRRFQADNNRHITEAARALRGTASGADVEMARTLEDAKAALDRARRDIDDAVHAARSYAARV